MQRQWHEHGITIKVVQGQGTPPMLAVATIPGGVHLSQSEARELRNFLSEWLKDRDA